ncbi:hypothetical protein [Singulisphaera acidiphila]|uniref:Uncharacterized protein n=1 Tax=Singulisphaera acidiphila (strain ATCC BAA-1392 / DSM 18658 / VKM B-2454 / MOB10) TaxID=886293 RepID=L0DA17_SINAD|nr:hypothetical protein [Singulisphaera acidiphila]AGA25710.1 hypothetical protein Sinac_1323 [Singulisphaera acidiphila DSM 18658]
MCVFVPARRIFGVSIQVVRPGYGFRWIVARPVRICRMNHGAGYKDVF